MTNIKPVGNNILVLPNLAKNETLGGIALITPESKPQEGIVIEVGKGRVLENGSTVPLPVKRGDTVIYSKYGGTELKDEGKDYVILDGSSVLGVRERGY